MNVPADIFKAYDIRGLVPGEITPELAYAIGRKFAALFLADMTRRAVIVGRDARPSSPALEKELVRGLREGGADVISIGLTTTPLFYFSVNVSSAAGGIMVTASHNPPQYNGFKITREKAVAVGLETGLGRLRDAIAKGTFSPSERTGAFAEEDFRGRYIDFLTGGVSVKPFTIAVDAGNGMAGIVLPQILQKLGVAFHALYLEPDGTFPNHEANPLKEETLDDLKKLMAGKKVDFGIALDGDGDRIGFLLPDGAVARGDIMLAFLASVYLKRYPGAAVVYAVNCSRIVPETVRALGGVPIRWKVGHTLNKEKMRETGAVLGGEISTHYFYKDMFGVESAMLTLIHVLGALTESGKTLQEALAPYFAYAKSPETNFEVADKGAILKKISEIYKDAKQDWLDGLTVEYPEWWFNARASNTEPLLRLNVEAKDEAMLKEKLAEIASLVKA